MQAPNVEYKTFPTASQNVDVYLGFSFSLVLPKNLVFGQPRSQVVNWRGPWERGYYPTT